MVPPQVTLACEAATPRARSAPHEWIPSRSQQPLTQPLTRRRANERRGQDIDPVVGQRLARMPDLAIGACCGLFINVDDAELSVSAQTL